MLNKAIRKRLAKRMANRARDKLTIEQREAIAVRYANNENVGDIASDLGVSKVTVYKWIRVAAEGGTQ